MDKNLKFKIDLRNKKHLLILLCVLVAGIFIGIVINKFYFEKISEIKIIRQNNYKFVHKPLIVEESEMSSLPKYKIIKSDLLNLINNKKATKKATDVSVYFHDFSNSQWVGVNETETYDPASLSKVPIMMAYLKLAESQPGILQKVVVFNEQINSDKLQTIKPAISITNGSAYTVEELIYRMIVNSDNNAEILLYNNINKSLITDVYNFLADYLVQNGASNDGISVKSYSLFFRLLYNASYLNLQMSERALELLQKTDFPQGIQAGVPASIEVTDKFGERALADSKGNIYSRELHDCGVVYYPDHDYILCIMTKGDNLAYLADTIKDISHLVYNDMGSK